MSITTLYSMHTTKNDISLAQWALVEEIRSGKWNNLDFPRIAREDFNLNGIEFVNTFFEVPTEKYLNQLTSNARDHNITMVLIMVDDEGDGAAETSSGRKQFVINHQKWIDIAHYLGCHAIRTNCRGPEKVKPKEGLQWAAETYTMLLEYAATSGVKILIENHGGLSNDPDWMVALMQEVNHPLFGTYPDWREPTEDFDNVTYLASTAPYAHGMSFRNQFSETLTAQMIQIAKESGFHGWWGIESDGRHAIHKSIELLKKYAI